MNESTLLVLFIIVLALGITAACLFVIGVYRIIRMHLAYRRLARKHGRTTLPQSKWDLWPLR